MRRRAGAGEGIDEKYVTVSYTNWSEWLSQKCLCRAEMSGSCCGQSRVLCVECCLELEVWGEATRHGLS